jgi:hypothetical protein
VKAYKVHISSFNKHLHLFMVCESENRVWDLLMDHYPELLIGNELIILGKTFMDWPQIIVEELTCVEKSKEFVSSLYIEHAPNNENKS